MSNPAIRDYKIKHYTHSIIAKYKNWEGTKEDARTTFAILLNCYLSKDNLENMVVDEEEKTLEFTVFDFIKESVSEQEIKDSYGSWFPREVEYKLPGGTEKRTAIRESLEVKRIALKQ